MGTKQNPGKYDCYAAAEPDEPLFVLMGRDPIAPLLVNLWADLKELLDGYGPEGRGTEKTKEARLCANQMMQWLGDDLPNVRKRLANLLFHDWVHRQHSRLMEMTRRGW